MRNKETEKIKRPQYLFSLIVLLLLFSCSEEQTVKEDCDFQRNLCIKRLENIEVKLDVEPKPPQAFKEEIFIINIKGEKNPAHELLLDLSMPGMYMGENRIALKKVEGNIYKGKGVIPRCPSGKTLWQAEIFIPGKGSVYFRFHVR